MSICQCTRQNGDVLFFWLSKHLKNHDGQLSESSNDARTKKVNKLSKKGLSSQARITALASVLLLYRAHQFVSPAAWAGFFLSFLSCVKVIKKVLSCRKWSLT